MFGEPCAPPKNCNLMSLIWTYLVKTDGVKKERCVCDGSPRQKGVIIMGKTYAAALKQSGAHLFWSLVALNNLLVYSADATNAFAEAPAPEASLYVTID